jgi:large-conductance mechanosensitive channel
MTFWILLVIAIVISLVSFKWFNVLISVCAAIAWLVLMAYNLTNPPTGITAGTFIHEGLTLIFIGMAIAILLIGVRNRNSLSENNFNRTQEENEENNRERVQSRSIMDYSNAEYKAYLRGRVRPKGR